MPEMSSCLSNTESEIKREMFPGLRQNFSSDVNMGCMQNSTVN